MKLKPKMFMKILVRILFGFSNCFTKSKYYDDSNTLVVDKLKDEMGGADIEEIVKLK